MKYLRSVWVLAALALLLAACNVADTPGLGEPLNAQAAYPLEWPVTGTVLSNINLRRGEVFSGIGIGAPFGTPVYAAYGGTVVTADSKPTLTGNLVEIRHANGYVTRYRNVTPSVRTGKRVRQGALIGRVASPLNALTRPQLKLEVRRKGKVIDWDKNVPVGTKVEAGTAIPYPFPGLGSVPFRRP